MNKCECGDGRAPRFSGAGLAGGGAGEAGAGSVFFSAEGGAESAHGVSATRATHTDAAKTHRRARRVFMAGK